MEERELRGMLKQAAEALRTQNPLAGSVTNAVTTDFVANAQIAVGGSAAMVYLPDEAQMLVSAGDSIYLNMGTLLPLHAETIPAAARAAHEQGKTCVLDPVGIGIGQLRTDILAELKEHRPRIIRGNASEIIALADLWELDAASTSASGVRGVDSTDEVDSALRAAQALARHTDGAVAVSGAVDLVVDATHAVRVQGGSPLMEKVTGSGCSLGGVCAVYAAVADPFTAAVAAVAHYDIAGLRAAEQTDAPASFKVAFIDKLYRTTPDDIAQASLKLV